VAETEKIIPVKKASRPRTMCKNLYRKAQQNKKVKSNSNLKELIVSSMTEVANISDG
jgi:hypothetical protein